MFEGGPSNPKYMVFHYAIGCLFLFFMGKIGYGLLGVLEEGRDLTVAFRGLILIPSVVGPPLLAYSFRMCTTLETSIVVSWSHFPFHLFHSLPHITWPLSSSSLFG